MTKTFQTVIQYLRGSARLEFLILVIRICFGFRVSCFEFIETPISKQFLLSQQVISLNNVAFMDIWSILYPQSFNIDIPEKSCIDDIIIYLYLIFWNKLWNILSRKYQYKASRVEIFPWRLFLFLVPWKAKAIEKRGRKLVPHTDGIGKVIRTRQTFKDLLTN